MTTKLTMSTLLLAPGSYVLSIDVGNTKADRRNTTDWRKAKVWEAGTKFYVRDTWSRHDQIRAEKLHLSFGTVDETMRRSIAVELVGDSHPSLHALRPGDGAGLYDRLAPHLEAVAESTDHLLARLGCRSVFGRWLVDHGHLSRERFEELWYRFKYDAVGADEPTTEEAEVK